MPRGGSDYRRQEHPEETGSRALGLGLITQTSWPPSDPTIQRYSSRLSAVIILALCSNHAHNWNSRSNMQSLSPFA